MSQADPAGDEPLDAGSIRRWRENFLESLREGTDSEVPCGSCTACCRASQFVHIEPDEADARSRIPSELLFPAPGLPLGHHVLGYDESGRCPMLGANGCTIYEHRPRACRVYDCRVFAASGVTITDAAKADIATRVRRWRFAEPTDADRRTAAALRNRADELRAEGVTDPTALALGAVQSAAHD